MFVVDARHGGNSGVGSADASAGVGDGCVGKIGAVGKGLCDNRVSCDDIGGANVGSACGGNIRSAW